MNTPAAPESVRRRRWLIALYACLYAALCLTVLTLIVITSQPSGLRGAVQGPSPELSAFAGKTLLTIETQGRASAQFDMRALQALPQVTHVVSTPWYLRKVAFQGPLLRDVLAAAGVDSGNVIDAVAVNDFTAEIPFSDARQYEVIVALRMDGKPMSPRDKGPLFVIYPYDQVPQQNLTHYYDLSMWQLDVLKVR